MQKHIVRQSDIRGIVGVDFQVDQIYFVTQAFLVWLQRSMVIHRIVVGMDGRLDSSNLYQKVAQAITDAGYQVYFVGVCPTPVFNHALYHLSAQAGIMITASGAGAQYNGLKLYVETKLVEGISLQEIYDIALEQQTMPATAGGKIIPCPIVDQYLDALWQEFAYLSQYNFSIVFDAGSGTRGPVLARLIKMMGWKRSIILHEQVDGEFPYHMPEPSEPSNLGILQQELKNNPGSFGVAFDGDGDRLTMIDEKGIVISSERMIAIFAQHVLAKHAHRAIVHDIVDSSWLDFVIYNAHGKSIAAKSKSCLLSSVVTKEKPIFVGQQHGRYFFYDRHVGYPDGVYVFLRMIDILVQQRCILHDLVVQLPKQIVKHSGTVGTPEQYY